MISDLNNFMAKHSFVLFQSTFFILCHCLYYSPLNPPPLTNHELLKIINYCKHIVVKNIECGARLTRLDVQFQYCSIASKAFLSSLCLCFSFVKNKMRVIIVHITQSCFEVCLKHDANLNLFKSSSKFVLGSENLLKNYSMQTSIISLSTIESNTQ